MVSWRFGDTYWTSPDEGLSTDFFYSYFQKNQMLGYENSEKAAGMEERTLVLLHGGEGKVCLCYQASLSQDRGICPCEFLA